MINNRQNGRRRGRGGIRPPNGSASGPERGNRLDNRARGNASQLHEKYKTLARDAQMQGDRVTSEYYLQFADHYFRILSESRARFEEQRRPRDDFQGRDDQQRGEDYQQGGGDYQAQADFQDEYDDDADMDGGDDRGNQQQPQRNDRFEEPRGDRRPRNNRAQADDRGNRANGNGNGKEARSPEPRFERSDDAPRSERTPRSDRGNGNGGEQRDTEARAPELRFEEKPADATVAERRPRGRPRRAQAEAAEPVAEERIEIDRLPPAFTPEPETAEEKPRRRTRRPRSDVAPADV